MPGEALFGRFLTRRAFAFQHVKVRLPCCQAAGARQACGRAARFGVSLRLRFWQAHRMKRLLPLLAAPALLGLLAGCAGLGGAMRGLGGAESEDPVLRAVATQDRELRDHLKAYTDTFAVLVMGAADAIVADPASTGAHRRNARLWALRMVPQCNTLAAQANPRVALIDLIAFAARQRQDFEAEGECEGAFGPRHDIALQAARDAETAAWETAERVMDAADAAVLKSEIAAWAATRGGRPFLGFDRMALLARAREAVGDYQKNRGTGFFSNLERTIGGTAYELNQLNRQVELLTHHAQHSPTYARWSAEALAHGGIGEVDLKTLHEDVSRLSHAIHQLSQIAHEVPETQLEAFLKLRNDTLDQVEARLLRTVARLAAVGVLLVVTVFGCLHLHRRALHRLAVAGRDGGKP